MKTIVTTLLAAVCVSGLLLTATARSAQTNGATPNDLNMNFVNARLEQVLNYLSDAAGFIVVQQTRVNGFVTIQGSHITKDEAADMLNTELNQNNYAAIREGNILTIMSESDARTGRIPVMMGNNPANIPNNDEIATWIIPIRFVEARELLEELSPFVSPQAIIIANEAGNTIVITDTQTKIRHLLKIIQAVDNSAEAGTEIRVFQMKYANPAEVANELSSAFPGAGSSDDQSPIQFLGGFGDMSGNPFGGAGTDAGSRLQKAAQITVVADSRIQAVIVAAAKDQMKNIAGMISDLDVPSKRDQKVYVFQVNNGDSQQVAQVLQSMFLSGNTSSGGSSLNSALMQRAQSTATSMGAITTSSFTSGSGGTGTGGGGGGGGGSGMTF